MARRYMRDERAANTLQTTALVNEVYLRLVDVKNVDWQRCAALTERWISCRIKGQEVAPKTCLAVGIIR